MAAILRTSMPTDSELRIKLDRVLVATDFSATSKLATAYAIAIARRHRAKLVLAHIVSSHSDRAVMDGWRAGQAEVTQHYLAGHLDGIEHQLLVKPGEIWPVLSRMITENDIDLLVLGTHGRVGIRKMILGSVAEQAFRHCRCPVLTVGPNASAKEPLPGPERILATTGFAPHSLLAVRYAARFAETLHSSLALLNVVTDAVPATEQASIREERLVRLRASLPESVHLGSAPQLFVEFGVAIEKILAVASKWKANLIVLGLRHVEESSRGEATWARAYEIVRQARCPVLTIRLSAK
jgi:nucleotide-binding universal stress UspA family protein